MAKIEVSTIKEYLENLPEDKKTSINEVFLSLDKFYAVVYLIAKNEHLTDLDKPERYEDRLAVIRQVRRKIETFIDSIGLLGDDLISDISSDYFEDFVNYKESSFELTNEDFLSFIRKISSLP
jgi:hypothetical protein